MNLHEKLVEIRKSIGGFTKDTKSYNYSYVSGAQVLSKIQEKMNELGVLLIPKIKNQNFEKHEYKNNKGKDALDFIVYGEMTYTWINSEKPEDFLEVPFYYTGSQDDISKAFGSGLTYSERYFVIKFFNIPTDADDPDSRDTSGRTSKNQNYNNNQYQKQNNNTQYNKTQNHNNTINNKMPTSAKEAQLLIVPDLFDKHKGKTLGAVWKEDKTYLASMITHAKTPTNIVEGILLMQQAAAAQQAAQKQGE